MRALAGDELMRCDRAIERRCLSIRRAPRGHCAPAVFGDSGEVPAINQQEQVGSVCNRDLAHHYSLRQSARRLPVQILPKVKQYGSFCSIVDSNQLARISRTIPAERRRSISWWSGPQIRQRIESKSGNRRGSSRIVYVWRATAATVVDPKPSPATPSRASANWSGTLRGAE